MKWSIHCFNSGAIYGFLEIMPKSFLLRRSVDEHKAKEDLSDEEDGQSNYIEQKG